MFFASIAAGTDLGLVRTGNEDSALHHPKLIAVADGMGGAAGGEVASKIAIRTLSEVITTIASEDIDDDSRVDLLQSALLQIESELAVTIAAHSELIGMGTTLTALMPVKDAVAMLHIGDSRCYRIRKGGITRLSHDHTVIQELIDQGKITADEAADHPQRSMLTQALMGKGDTNFESYPIQLFPAEAGDIYLVASDGLTAVLNEEMILKVITANSIDAAVNNLVALVRDGGAPDNVTLVLAEFASNSSDLQTSPSFIGAAYE